MKVLYKTKIQQDIYNLILILFILLNNDLSMYTLIEKIVY